MSEESGADQGPRPPNAKEHSMKRMIAAFATLTALSLAFSGCGGDDDDDDNGGNAGTGNTAGKTSTPSEGGGGTTSTPGEAGSAPTDGNVPCDADEATTCQNETDCPFVVDGTARTTAQTCGKEQCLGSEDEDCARDCILDALEMSSECATCYADLVNCTIDNCVVACIGDPDSDGCHECQATAGCRPTFDECSGLGQ
jgi:hypothetical protein